MSAWRNTVLSISPTRLQNFSKVVEENIKKQSLSNQHKSKKSKHKSRTKKEKPRLKKVTKLQSSKPSKKKPQKKKKKEESEASTDTNEAEYEINGLDLSKEFFPLKQFVKERGTLLNHIFAIINDQNIIEMLPNDLKNKPLQDIKNKISEQLQIISTQRLECVIIGEELDFSSGTESSDQEEQINNEVVVEEAVCSSKILQTNEVDSTTSDMNAAQTVQTPLTSQAQYESASPLPDHNNIETVDVTEDEYELTSDYEDMVDELLEGSLENANTTQSKEQQPIKQTATSVSTRTVIPEKNPEAAKSRSEILELEMRARAIRSLMKNVASNIKSSL